MRVSRHGGLRLGWRDPADPSLRRWRGGTARLPGADQPCLRARRARRSRRRPAPARCARSASKAVAAPAWSTCTACWPGEVPPPTSRSAPAIASSSRRSTRPSPLRAKWAGPASTNCRLACRCCRSSRRWPSQANRFGRKVSASCCSNSTPPAAPPSPRSALTVTSAAAISCSSCPPSRSWSAKGASRVTCCYRRCARAALPAPCAG